MQSIVESGGFRTVLGLVLLFAGLSLPGAALMRALHVPATVACSFVGSAVALYLTVLLLDAANVPISLGSVVVGLMAITVVARLVARRRSPLAEPPPSLLGRSRDYNALTGMGAWTPLYILFVAAAVYRAWHEPLAGPDVEFRWSFLSEQMLRLGSLDFYPPRTTEDFFSYFWAESIPPGAAALHAWAYACAGEMKPSWTIPAVLLQLWSIHDLTWRTMERVAGVNAARFACLAAAACPLLTWSVLLGQETGLTTLSLIGLAFSVVSWNATRETRWSWLAGICGILGASAREYGLVFPALGAIALFAFQANRDAWRAFSICAVAALWWPVRTALLTGNPFYSLSFGSLPSNDRFIAWVEHDAQALGNTLSSAAGWSDVLRYLVLYAPIALVGWISISVGAFRRFSGALIALFAVCAVLGVWALSVRYTNGGLFYSMRVTAPALALGSICAGAGIAALASLTPRARVPLAVAGIIIFVALMPATMALPRNPWRTGWREWPSFAAPSPLRSGLEDETVALVVRTLSAANARNPTRLVVLADGPGFQRRFQPAGIKVVPPWSPSADWLFDRTLSPAEAARQWRQSGIGFLVITKWQHNLDFFDAHSRWKKPPFQLQLVGETKATAVFAIRAQE